MEIEREKKHLLKTVEGENDNRKEWEPERTSGNWEKGWRGRGRGKEEGGSWKGAVGLPNT